MSGGDAVTRIGRNRGKRCLVSDILPVALAVCDEPERLAFAGFSISLESGDQQAGLVA